MQLCSELECCAMLGSVHSEQARTAVMHGHEASDYGRGVIMARSMAQLHLQVMACHHWHVT